MASPYDSVGKEGLIDERSRYYSQGLNAGWLTRNEVRKLEGLEPLQETAELKPWPLRPEPKTPWRVLVREWSHVAAVLAVAAYFAVHTALVVYRVWTAIGAG